MKVAACRITKAKHASIAFSGEGAWLVGGRWNSRGTLVVYTAGSASLAMLEMLVHLQPPELLEQYVLFVVTFDEALIQTIELKRLPRNWGNSPSPNSLRRIGDEWVHGAKSVVLRVPSVLVSTEWNYLINPGHPDYRKLETGPKTPVKFDPRLRHGPNA